MAIIFRGKVFTQMIVNPGAKLIEGRFARPTDNPTLMVENLYDLNELLNKTLYVHNNNMGIANRSLDLLKAAEELDQLLVSTYHIH